MLVIKCHDVQAHEKSVVAGDVRGFEKLGHGEEAAQRAAVGLGPIVPVSAHITGRPMTEPRADASTVCA